MTYELFKEELIAQLKDLVDANESVDVRPILKNNDLLLDGLTIVDPSVNISPTIYLNSCYELYNQGQSVLSIAEDMLEKFRQYQLQESVDISFFSDFSQVKNRIIYKLVNMKQNQQLLEQVPFVPYLDLAIVFCYYMEKSDATFPGAQGCNATILIHNEILETWQVGPKDLLSAAKKNTPKLLPSKIESIASLLGQMFEDNSQAIEDLEEIRDYPMFVLTNQVQYLGAAALLYSQILKKCADIIEDDIVILPSSVHEVILVPYRNDVDLEEMSDMVRQVNASCVAEDEILSDHAYYYNRQSNQISYM